MVHMPSLEEVRECNGAWKIKPGFGIYLNLDDGKSVPSAVDTTHPNSQLLLQCRRDAMRQGIFSGHQAGIVSADREIAIVRHSLKSLRFALPPAYVIANSDENSYLS